MKSLGGDSYTTHRVFQRFPYGFPRYSHDLVFCCNGVLKYSNGIPIVFMWHSYEIHKVFLWFLYCIPRYCYSYNVSIHSYGIPVVSQRCSYVFPLVFPSIPTVFLWLSQVLLWYPNFVRIVF